MYCFITDLKLKTEANKTKDKTPILSTDSHTHRTSLELLASIPPAENDQDLLSMNDLMTLSFDEDAQSTSSGGGGDLAGDMMIEDSLTRTDSDKLDVSLPRNLRKRARISYSENEAQESDRYNAITTISPSTKLDFSS